MSDFDNGNLELYLKNYYHNVYPYDLIIKWLSYPEEKKSDILSNREFAFVMKDDFHVRFLSVNNIDEFKEKVVNLNPYKIDIGAIYNRPPRDRRKIGDFFPRERELVFDIDLTDYDSIRNCCKKTNVCQKCWRWITIAVKVLNCIFRNHFGFKRLLWVFSGRRGIHCWVTDRKARSLANSAREAIMKYLTFDKKSSIINKYRVHPLAEHAYRNIMDSGEFEKLISEQGWLDSPEHWNHVLKLCPDPEMALLLEKEFQELSSTEMRWDSLKKRFDEIERAIAIDRKETIPSAPNESAENFLRLFVLEYAYPRLDEKVTTGLNHLLKAPFTVHPKTGNIAIPLDPNKIKNLQLDQLPRVDKFFENEKGKENAEGTVSLQASLMSPYIGFFEEFINKLES